MFRVRKIDLVSHPPFLRNRKFSVISVFMECAVQLEVIDYSSSIEICAVIEGHSVVLVLSTPSNREALHNRKNLGWSKTGVLSLR